MALSGSYIFDNNGANHSFKFSWTATQSVTSNTSSVKWNITVDGPTSSAGMGSWAYGYSFKIGSTTIHTNNDTNGLTMYGGANVASGTTTITHSSSGTGSFTVSFTGYIGTNPALAAYVTDSTSFTLNSIARPSKVTATNANIGAATTITISRYVSSYTHTLTYKFGSMTGTIATKDTRTTINWVLSPEFYTQIPNATSGTVTITCQTYNGNTLVGTSTTTFKATASADICSPLLDPAVVDVNSSTIALTGDANKLIRYESMVEYSFNAAAKNEATIKTLTVKNGNNTYTGSAIGVIDNVENGEFVFTVIDSRGLSAQDTVTKQIVNYVKPTCYQTVKGELAGETGAKITLTIHGNYFHGNFGKVDNTYSFAIRYTQLDGNMGEWMELPSAMLPTLGDDDTYSLTVTIDNLSYNKAYEIQSRLTDKLHTVESSVYTARVLPVFDWDKDDFNFNVPVNMNGETILRHNKEANNLVVSASGGSIYFRPAGTDSTSTEMRLNQNGDLVLNGTLIVDGVDIIQALRNANII